MRVDHCYVISTVVCSYHAKYEGVHGLAYRPRLADLFFRKVNLAQIKKKNSSECTHAAHLRHASYMYVAICPACG